MVKNKDQEGRMDSASINEITKNLDVKLRGIKLALSLTEADDKTAREANDILRSVSEDIGECKEALSELVQCIENKNEQAKALKNLTNEVKQMDLHISQALENLVVREVALPSACESVRTESSSTVHSACSGENHSVHSAVSLKKNGCVPQMSRLTQGEYDAIPKYMKNRITLKMMNDVIDDLNKTLTIKYTLLGRSTSSLSINDGKQYRKFKSQENGETKGVYFCVVDDLKKYSTFKLDNTGKNILISLRHCHRIREIRSSSLIRYAVIV